MDYLERTRPAFVRDKDLDAATGYVRSQVHRRRNAIYGGDSFPQDIHVAPEEYDASSVRGEYPMFVVGRMSYWDPQTGRKWWVESSDSLQGMRRQPVLVGIPQQMSDEEFYAHDEENTADN